MSNGESWEWLETFVNNILLRKELFSNEEAGIKHGRRENSYTENVKNKKWTTPNSEGKSRRCERRKKRQRDDYGQKQRDAMWVEQQRSRQKEMSFREEDMVAVGQ